MGKPIKKALWKIKIKNLSAVANKIKKRPEFIIKITSPNSLTDDCFADGVRQQSNPLSYLPPPLFRTDLQLLYLFSSSRDVCWLAACTRSITAQPSQYYSSPDSPPRINIFSLLCYVPATICAQQNSLRISAKIVDK